MRSRDGFTLIEFLVSMAITGILLVAVMALLSSTYTFTNLSISNADQLRELNDISGYIGDNIRRASTILPTATVNGASCALTDTLPCFSLIVSEARASTDIDTFIWLSYRIINRSSLGDDFKETDAWADSNTFVIVEQREVLCSPTTTTCTSFPPTVTTASNTTSFVVLDYLTLQDETNTAYTPFVINGNQIDLQFRVARRVDGNVRALPSDDTYTLSVSKRN